MRSALHTKIPVDAGYTLTVKTFSAVKSYEVDSFEMKQPAKLDSTTASAGMPIAQVKGTEQKDARKTGGYFRIIQSSIWILQNMEIILWI
ncbi:MAG TPA: hypothetical protein DEP60_06665 [Ruminococcaceae bacterium]|nr:hypothetical protein [Oscillospiraceae bacterium]